MVRHIFKKDWRLLWPMVALVTAIQIAHEWAAYKLGFFGGDLAIAELFRLLDVAWYAAIAALAVAVVDQDPIPGVDQDWLIRPIDRTALLLAKLLFALLTISVPMLVLNLTHAVAMGFPLSGSLENVLFKELYVYVCLIVPVLALAATTRTMTELTVFGTALIVVYAVCLSLTAVLFGVTRCPTCGTGVAWLQHVLQHAGILCGAVAILFLQYYKRQTGTARVLAVCGAAALVFVQLPWNTAFAIERWVSGSIGTPESIRIDIDAHESHPVGQASISQQVAGWQATRALLHANVDEAARYLRRRAHLEDAAVVIDLPVRISGESNDELLLVDRSEVNLFGTGGRLLYRGTNLADGPDPLAPQAAAGDNAPWHTSLTVGIPASIYNDARLAPVHLQMDYSLTLLEMASQHKLPALDGAIRTPEMGLCATRASQDGVTVRCKQLGRTPFCYSATLYGPSGRHNPEVLICAPDYRPYFTPLTSVLTILGVDMPTRDPVRLAHYEVDGSKLEESSVLLKTYAVREHFTRRLVVSALQLPE